MVRSVDAVQANPSVGVAARARLALLLAIVGVILFIGLRHNVLLGLSSLVTLAVLLSLFWRPGEPLIFIYVFLFQWLETSIGLFYSNFHDIALDESHQLATILLLVGLLVQAIGVRWAAGPLRTQYRRLAEIQVLQISQGTLFKLYLAALAIAVAARLLATLIPGLSQPLLVLPLLKWAAYVIFTFASFYKRDANRTLWFAVFLFELMFSLGDYFSSFKFVFVFTFLGIALAQVKFSPRKQLALGTIVAIAILFAAIWSGIKGEYRYFVSGGQQAQVVTVEYSERLGKITELISEMDWDDVMNGFDLLFRRVEYAEYFADVTTFVPDFMPHTQGELWIDAFRRPFMPRLFFPEKAIIDESELTIRYTGRDIAGFGEGTQVSIGYIAEAYIDFGTYGLVPLMLLLGLIQGWAYRRLMHGERSRGIVGIGLACAAFVMSFGSIGTSSAKLVGGFVVALLVIWLFVRVIVPWRLQGLLDPGINDQGAQRSTGRAG